MIFWPDCHLGLEPPEAAHVHVRRRTKCLGPTGEGSGAQSVNSVYVLWKD